MSNDEQFTPKLGRSRARLVGVSYGRAYLNKILKTANLARGGAAVVKGKSGFTGSRIGRGNGVAAVFALRGDVSPFRQRRVVVKSRIAKLAGKGIAAATAHMRYLQRDGVTKEGLPGELYRADADRADGRDFMARCEGDRHQFRFIVSPEDGNQYDDLKSVTRRLMSRMEEDLGTRLDWVAVDHFNTGHPHTHILIRGKDELGKDLVIAKEYITSGVRERAMEIVSLDLGPRTQREIDIRLQAEVTHERFTSIDRQLLDNQTKDGCVRAVDSDTVRQSLLAGRLQTLKRLGLAEPTGPADWRLSDNLEPILKRLGERGDIIKQLNRDMKALGREAGLVDVVMHHQDPARRNADYMPPRVTGAIIGRGLSDELEDRHHIVLDGIDGRVHVIDIGKGDRTPHMEVGSVLTIEPNMPVLRKSDMTIAEVAARNDGSYNVAHHMNHDQSATERFAEAHVRRLEAIRRITGKIERTSNGDFKVGSNYLDVALEYEKHQVREAPAKIEVETTMPLDKQRVHNGPTWLDRQLISGESVEVATSGFGETVADALKRRQQWLVQEGLAERQPDGTVAYDRGAMQRLSQRQLNQVGVQMSEELGLKYVPTKKWEAVEGRLTRTIERSGEKYGVVERAKDFSLVPWRKELERGLGQHISGMDRGGGIEWEIGRQRGLGL